MKFVLTILVAALALLPLSAQTVAKKQQPKLIVGIVVDQMRYDYLYRYYDKYGSGGFKRLLGEGFSCENTHFNYMPTYTGPGHASIYTGTTPSVHGIIGNDWWDRIRNRTQYVTADERYQAVGGAGAVGQHSPAVLLSSTITDELRLSNALQSKVVGVCMKDRGSILPAGHIPNACYWYDGETGNWITSTYYPDSLGLPKWVQDFNAKKLSQAYLTKDWATVQPLPSYTESFPNWNKYELRYQGDTTGLLPYKLPVLAPLNGIGMVRATPFGNTLTTEFALATIENMGLGTDAFPDFLALSYSSPDYCGHQFGIHSEEIQDVYLRLDVELARLLDYLDEKFGRNNVLVFLTADHGAAETPAHLLDIGIPAGILGEEKFVKDLNAHLEKEFGVKMPYVTSVMNQQVYVNEAILHLAKVEASTVYKAIAKYLRKLPGIYDVYTREDLPFIAAEVPFIQHIRRGFHPRRSGDVIFQLDPAWFPESFFAKGGTTHGSPYAYDTHIPLIWYGWKVKPGETHDSVDITDIAPTLAAMLRIMEPSGTTGKVIGSLMR